ncbi:MAG TPA: HAD hydrolase family protein [Kiritimatiellia bacterium]|nr:HAD hydrolase family protein [Kiritimatiellia bacterium]HRZ11491.1 HAD hydrolase family protein [Kiritimatiellia bacterium]HSA16958.1 HAD hydrolase family protein [Kiritimatiellia bacterium]
MRASEKVTAKEWAAVKLLALDFDGVMTDNRVLVDQDGKEAVLCHRGDGMGVGLLKKEGVGVIVISMEPNPVVSARCRKLKIDCIQNCDKKLKALQQVAAARGLKPREIAFVGNDINDLECLRWVGLPVAVADAEPEVLEAAAYVTKRPGGFGAVREVAERILRAG